MGKEVRALGKREGEEGWKSDRERVKEKGKVKTSEGEGKEGDGVAPSLDTPVGDASLSEFCCSVAGRQLLSRGHTRHHAT